MQSNQDDQPSKNCGYSIKNEPSLNIKEKTHCKKKISDSKKSL